MMKKYKTIRIALSILSVLSLVACNAPGSNENESPFKLSSVEDNSAPFTFASVQLGMPKDELLKERGLRFCNPRSATTAQCFIGKDGEAYSFFGAKTESETVDLVEPYSNVSKITFHIEKKAPHEFEIEQKWGLKGRCVTGYDFDSIIEKSNDLALGVISRGLREIGLKPFNTGFVCLGKGGEFIEISHSRSNRGGSVSMFFLRPELAQMYERIFDTRAKLESVAANQNAIILNTTPATANITSTRVPPIPVVAEYEALSTKCTESSEKDIAACNELDKTWEKVKEAGWCWGPDGAPEYRKGWIRCQ